jgi:peptidoglycan/LPS O-acetylase OafA/YrhL
MAVGVVVGLHFHVVPPGGVAGVDLFFVISGFLITTLLLEEAHRLHRISLRHFWARRALRLGPALLCAIALALMLSLLATSASRHNTIAGLPWVLFYSSNWIQAKGSNDLGLLGHTWSLAIEEQFYLFWPLICVAFLARTRDLGRAAVIVSGLAFVDAVYLMLAMNHWGPQRAYYGTDTHGLGLLAGAALALAVFRRISHPGNQVTSPRALDAAAAAALVVFLSVCVTGTRSPTQSALIVIVATVASTVLVARLVLTPAGPLAAVFSQPPVTWVGKRSYGIYLYHLPVAVVFLQLCTWRGPARTAALCGCVAFTVLLAYASYRWIEAPFLRRKDRLIGVRVEPEKVATPQMAAAPSS